MNRALRLILCTIFAATTLAAVTGCSRSDNGAAVGQTTEAQTEAPAEGEAASTDDGEPEAPAEGDEQDEAAAGDEAAAAGDDAVVPGDVAADLCADFIYQLCRTDADCPAGLSCADVTDACRAGTCSCDPATGAPGVCTRDCRSGFGLCQRPDAP